MADPFTLPSAVVATLLDQLTAAESAHEVLHEGYEGVKSQLAQRDAEIERLTAALRGMVIPAETFGHHGADESGRGER